MCAFADRSTRSNNEIIDSDTRDGLDTITTPENTSGDSEADCPPNRQRFCEFSEIQPEVCA